MNAQDKYIVLSIFKQTRFPGHWFYCQRRSFIRAEVWSCVSCLTQQLRRYHQHVHHFREPFNEVSLVDACSLVTYPDKEPTNFQETSLWSCTTIKFQSRIKFLNSVGLSTFRGSAGCLWYIYCTILRNVKFSWCDEWRSHPCFFCLLFATCVCLRILLIFRLSACYWLRMEVEKITGVL